MSGYTVIDFETTGIFPKMHDRIVEVGVVQVSDSGEIENEWSTLVNPERDLGPQHIHGIFARDILHAPRFADVAPHLLNAVAGRTIVAHNARFDLRFLMYEMERAGYLLADGMLNGICTMEWSSVFVDAESRKLVHCCAAAGLEHVDQHDALGDARATAYLLTHYLELAGYRPPWDEWLKPTRAYAWPPVGLLDDPVFAPRSLAATPLPSSWLDRVVGHMVRTEDPRIDSYLAVLDQAMLDRLISAHEEEALISLAGELGMTRGGLIDVHGDYLQELARVALDDGVVTHEERADLELVASLIGLRSDDVDVALAEAAEVPTTAAKAARFALERGDSIVLTGDMRRAREEWTNLATSAGLEVGGVSKKTKVVVAADADSLSGKAKKARLYGIPVISEDAFEKLLLAV